MDYKAIVEEANKALRELPEDRDYLRHLASKDTHKGKIFRMFRPSYWRRENLIREGEVFLGYAFKEYRPDIDVEIHPTWVIHSPSSKVYDDPDILKRIRARLEGYVNRDRSKCPNKDVYDVMMSRFADHSYVEVPEECSEGILAYISVVFAYKSTNPEVGLGHNVYIGSRGVSKEILYLPKDIDPRFGK